MPSATIITDGILFLGYCTSILTVFRPLLKTVGLRLFHEKFVLLVIKVLFETEHWRLKQTRYCREYKHITCSSRVQ